MGRGRAAAGATPAWLRPLAVVTSILALLTAGPYGFLWLLFWAASDSWDFEGSDGFKRWLLVKGSRLDTLGVVAQTSRPARYSVRFQEGTFPGWRVVQFDSLASPPDIVAVYADRCRAMGLRITEHEPARNSAPRREEAMLVCEIETYIDVQIVAERMASATISEVSVRVWGSD